MCGIVGIYSSSTIPDWGRNYLRLSMQTMVHRGPDSGGFWDGNHLLLGFRRLAIRDLSEEANQPFHSSCGQYVLVYNGEIYGTKNIVDDLISRGVFFRTKSDTEILLNCLIFYGINKTLQLIDGIFAFAFYNKISGELILSRDRAGVKPLYYGFSSDKLIFSSQYDHIVNFETICNNSIDSEALGMYLRLGFVPSGMGLIKDTFLLPHGSYLSVDKNMGANLYKYYDFPVSYTKSEISSKAIEDILCQVVSEQMVSDVPVGTFLSGGVDSSLVTYCAKESESKVSSFNIGFGASILDESATARELASYFETQHFQKQFLNSDLESLIEQNTIAFSEPFADPSSLPTLLLSQFARNNIIVALSGDGGDELFWGYLRNKRLLNQKDFLGNKFLLIKALIRNLKNKKEKIPKKLLFIKNISKYFFKSIFIPGGFYWTKKIIGSHVKLPSSITQIPKTKLFIKNNVDGYMDLMRKIEFDFHLQRILIKVDRSSMFHSLEVRVPFLSSKLLDIASQTSYNLCITTEIEGKAVLKKIFKHTPIYSKLLEPKKGFSISIDEIIRKDLKNEIEKKLHNMPVELSRIFNEKKIEKLLKEHYSGKNWGWYIWALFILVNWYNHHRQNTYLRDAYENCNSN